MAYVPGKSGYFDIPGINGFTARIDWSETYDLNANKSKISIDKISIQSTIYGNMFYPGGTLSIDGTVIREMNFNAPATHSVYLNAGDYWWEISPIGSANAFPWVSGEIEHDADGSKVITISLDILMWRSDIGPILGPTGSATIELTDIPRASSATVPNFTIGTKGIISISRASADFTHALRVKLGNKTYSISSNVGASYEWTPSVDMWCPLITDATSAACTMFVDTYNGDIKIGTAEYGFTLYVPAEIVPSIISFNASIVNENAIVDGWGVAVKGHTKLQWATVASGAYGSTIKKYAFSAGGQTGDAASGTTGIIQTAGSVIPSIKATDSRGRTVSKSADAIEVYDYAAPNVANAAAYRCDENGNANEAGTHVRITLTANISAVGGRNSATLQYRYRLVGGSFGSWIDFTSGAILSGFDVENSYEFELRAVDALGMDKVASAIVPTERVWLNGREGNNGAAFGKYAEEDDLLDVAWNMRVRGKLFLDQGIPTDTTLKVLENGALAVNTTDAAEADNTLPITSAGVHLEIGNINKLLSTI